MVSDQLEVVFIEIPKTASTSICSQLIEYGGDLHAHAPLWWLHRQDPKRRDYFSFAVARNVYERLISMVFWKKKEFDKHFFREIVELSVQRGGGNTYASMELFLMPEPDYIMSFETLDEDWMRVCHYIGIPYKQLPVMTTTKHNHYSTYYNSWMLEMVNKTYASEIVKYGFKFDDRR